MARAFSKFVIYLFIPGSLAAQMRNVEFKAGNFKYNPPGFKFAQQNLLEGNELIQNGNYGAAPIDYLAADSINPFNADLNAKIGVCYLNGVNKAKCLNYFRLAYQLKNDISKRINYFLGRGYHLNSQWDSALIEYQLALKHASGKELEEINKYIDECNNGMDLTQRPVKVIIENMGSNINGPNSDFRPLVTGDGSELIFTSMRHTFMGAEIDPVTGEYSEKLFISHKKKGIWDTAQPLEPPVNTTENEEGAFLAPDGKTLYIHRNTGGGDIYKSTYSEKTGWSEPVALNDSINSVYNESSICFSPDGKTMFFVSNRPGGIGGKDIYTSTMNSDSTWSSPVNMGSDINTPYDEDGVFMNPDGKTLYFSSKGHNSMGGYDIFVTVNKDGKWLEPKNLGSPVNTPDDDVYFTTSDNGYYGYYARTTEEGRLDIFRVNMEAFMPAEWIYKGTITDSITHEKLKVGLEFFDKSLGNTSPFGADTITGEYSLTMPANHVYTIRIGAKGYKEYIADITVPDTAAYRTIEKNITLEKAAPMMNDSCLLPLAQIMERFKGVVKDTDLMKNAIAHFGPSFCLKNLRFAIQLGVFHSTQKFNYKKYSSKAILENLPDGTTRITAGSYTTYAEARKFLEEYKKKGLKDTWIVGICNGKRYVLKELLHPAN
ncbi:MAG: hypothetical protein ACLQQ4_13950 [Bacteroidia bacterium]